MLVGLNIPSRSPLQVILAQLFLTLAIRVKTETPTQLTLIHKGLGLVYEIIGTALVLDILNNTWSGDADSLKIYKQGAPAKFIDVTLPTSTSLAALNTAADGITGKPKPGNVGAIEKVMQPKNSPFPDTEVTGHNGKDTVKGFGGNDTFELKGGNDRIFASPGNIAVDAGKGRDTFDASLFKVGAEIDLKKGTAKIAGFDMSLTSVESVIGTSAIDIIVGSDGNNRLIGGKGNDVLDGEGGNDRIDGGPGNDSIHGGSGNDVLKGGSGDDTVDGGPGRDLIDGGPGNDVLIGGAGPDTFLFNGKPKAKNGTDSIPDWETGVDKIKIAGAKAKDVTVKTVGNDTHIEYHNSKIILENVQLDKADIDFLF